VYRLWGSERQIRVISLGWNVSSLLHAPVCKGNAVYTIAMPPGICSFHRVADDPIYNQSVLPRNEHNPKHLAMHDIDETWYP
jgi:hypothetical protein